ncbi:VOC family protein [Neisseria sp. 74A18]|uniref:VOC family protein n=1 Tax=Neisseria sp. 74A18 TaxID=1696094 RepID=UPI0006CAE4F3|nr:VOC family protein [Neisseria sp. 74A18]KPN74450.1 hypothetical protein AKG43_02560 [Neisseria sp. 74A18]
MKLFKTSSLVSVINASDFQTSLAWYRTWLGEPDVVPMENMAEWRIADNAWLQLTDSGTIAEAEVIIGVDDIAACRKALLGVGIEAGDINDWEVVLTCGITDPDNHKIFFAQAVG